MRRWEGGWVGRGFFFLVGCCAGGAGGYSNLCRCGANPGNLPCPALPSRLAEPHNTHHNTNIIMTKNKWDQRNTATATANNLTDG